MPRHHHGPDGTPASLSSSPEPSPMSHSRQIPFLQQEPVGVAETHWRRGSESRRGTDRKPEYESASPPPAAETAHIRSTRCTCLCNRTEKKTIQLLHDQENHLADGIISFQRARFHKLLSFFPGHPMLFRTPLTPHHSPPHRFTGTRLGRAKTRFDTPTVVGNAVARGRVMRCHSCPAPYCNTKTTQGI